MFFSVPEAAKEYLARFDAFINKYLVPHLSEWNKDSVIPRAFFGEMARGNWLGYELQRGGFVEQPSLKQAFLYECLANLSPGVAVAVVVQVSLGMKGLSLFGSREQKEAYLDPAVRGEKLICLGNTEPLAGSDVASIVSEATRISGGWLLNGTKSYVTNGNISDLALVTAVSDPQADRNRRLSMFLVDLTSEGVSRSKLHKQVWIPSDLTRLHFKNVFIPDESLVGQRGRGLQQVLDVFTHSRLSIGALTLGTAEGAFILGLDHARKRKVFGRRIVDYQAKSFEIAHLFTKIEAARLMLWKACSTRDEGKNFRLESSMAKYLAVEIAREVGIWATDVFGAASVMFEHPIHKYPLDAWAASLGEGTQDIQKLIIFRELIKKDEKLGAGV